MEDQKSIIVTGNPIDGFVFYGPFEDSNEAIEWADKNIDDDWWEATLQPPKESGD